MVEFDVSKYYGNQIVPLRFVMQMAPTVFICLFGAMLEVVYRKSYAEGSALAATSRLLQRSAQCYLLYALAVLSRVIVGDFSLSFGIRCLLLIGGTPYTDILKFYFFILLFAPLLIAFRNKFGLRTVIALAVLIHALYPALVTIPAPPQISGKDYIGMGTRFFIGVGDTIVGGPSLVHGLALVLCGMVIGYALVKIQSECERERKIGWKVLFGLTGFALLATILLWTNISSVNVVRDIADLTLRNENHPIYSALGLSATTIGVVLCTYLFDILKIRCLDFVKFIGSVSLFTFSFGNILLIIQPFQAMGEVEALILFLIFGVLIAVQSWVFYGLTRKDFEQRRGYVRFFAMVVQMTMKEVNQVIKRALAPFVNRYSRMITT